MGSVQIMRAMVDCDGCKAIFGLPDGFDSGMEARAAAYAVGWRFPNQVTKAGKALSGTSDVCPVCIGGWEPALRSARSRLLTRAEAAQETRSNSQ